MVEMYPQKAATSVAFKSSIVTATEIIRGVVMTPQSEDRCSREDNVAMFDANVRK
jgi:hypothetical protein